MYGKIFDSIYDGTLADNWQALITFQQLIVLCDADGIIDMTPTAISRRTGIPIEHIEAGLKTLESPDPYSRTEGNEGRRIQLLDEHRPWGWYIVNHKKYKALQDADTIREQNRLRKQRQRERSKESQTVTDSHASSRHTDTDTDTLKDLGQNKFDQFWEVYPKKRKKKESKEVWKKKKLEGIAEKIITDVTNRKKHDQRWLEDFIPDPTTYLRGERWDDEIQTRLDNVHELESHAAGAV